MGDDSGHPHPFGIDGGQTIGGDHPEFVETGTYELCGMSGGCDTGGPQIGDGLVDRFHSRKSRWTGRREHSLEAIVTGIGGCTGRPQRLATTHTQALSERAGGRECFHVFSGDRWNPSNEIFDRCIGAVLLALVDDRRGQFGTDTAYLTETEANGETSMTLDARFERGATTGCRQIGSANHDPVSPGVLGE